MRVLLVHNRYRHAGGEETHVELLERSLRDTGVDVHVLQVDSATVRGVRAELRTLARVAYSASSRQLVRDEARRLRADVVHFHNLWPLLTPAAIHGAREAGARTALTIHNYRFACPNGTLLRGSHVHDDCLEGSSLLCGLKAVRHGGPKVVAYGAALSIQRRLGMLARWVDAFVVPTQFVADCLRRAGHSRSQIRVIRLGTPEQPVSPVPRNAARAFLFVGRLSPEKGLDVLLDAAHLSGLPVGLAGVGPMAPHLRSRSQPTVRFYGHCDHVRLAALRAASVAAIVPSVCHETSGFSVIEAAAAGRATIASNIGGLPEIVRHEETGLLVTPGDASELAEAMSRLWVDSDLAQQLGSEAAELAVREHRVEQSAAHHLELYEGLVSR